MRFFIFQFISDRWIVLLLVYQTCFSIKISCRMCTILYLDFYLSFQSSVQDILPFPVRFVLELEGILKQLVSSKLLITVN